MTLPASSSSDPSRSAPRARGLLGSLPRRSRPTTRPDAAPKPLAVRLFDAAAMGLYPFVARALGYRFRTGNDHDLVRDAHAVHGVVWSEKGMAPPPGAASVAARYDRAVSTWIVAYHRGVPVGTMALLDLRRASVTLEIARKLPPPDLDLDTTREIARLAILRAHRGGAQTVMIGLLREMLAWSVANDIAMLFSGALPTLFEVYRRFNPTARIVEPADDHAPEDPTLARYFENIRAEAARGIHFTFEVAGASPWNVFSRFLRRRVRTERPA